MNKVFEGLIAELPLLMDRLVSSPLMPWSKLSGVPQKGIYVFYDDNIPIYVGRTNRMRARLKEHARPSSTHNSAPFAFNLAKKEALKEGLEVRKPRKELSKDVRFNDIFLGAKKRVSEMDIRVIEINDPVLQTLFEVYASLELGTSEFNSFDNH